MHKIVFRLALMIALAMTGSASFAADHIKNWRAHPVSGDCGMIASYTDGTVAIFSLSKLKNGDVIVIAYASNPGWTIPDGKVEADVRIDNSKPHKAPYAEAKNDGTGPLVTMGYTDVDLMLSKLAAGNNFKYVIDGKSYGPYGLKSSGIAIADMRECAGMSASAGNGGRSGIVSQPVGTQRNSTSGGDSVSLAKQIDRLIFRDSRRWVFNRYKAGGVHQTDITESVDDENYTIRAYYWYNGRQRGYVDVFVIDGRFDCMRYHDNPTICVPVN